jgi:hypothetical protein
MRIICKARDLQAEIDKAWKEKKEETMASSSTPGPWYATYSKTNEFEGGNIRADHHVDGDGALLFQTGPMFHDYQVNREEELANLHLAAAAPQMLAALEELVWEFENGLLGAIFTPSFFLSRQAIATTKLRGAKQAIAKARKGGE